MFQNETMTHLAEKYGTVPKLILGVVTTGAGATATQISEAISRAPEPHWAQVMVWILTACGALATTFVGFVTGYIKIATYINGRRARSRAKKRNAQKLLENLAKPINDR